jgi:hypothetical protein
MAKRIIKALDRNFKIESANKIEAFDFTMNQDLKIGDKVKGGRFEGKVVQITRVQDVYTNRQDFEDTQEIYGNKGLSWDGNEIMTIYIEDSDGAQVEKFVYEVEKLNDADLSDVPMPPQKGETLASNKIKSEEIYNFLTPGGRNGLADVMVTYIFGDDYKSAYESLVRQMSDDEFLEAYNYIKRMSWDGEEGSEEENMLNEAEKEFFQE